jgi:hypothetical protein
MDCCACIDCTEKEDFQPHQCHNDQKKRVIWETPINRIKRWRTLNAGGQIPKSPDSSLLLHWGAFSGRRPAVPRNLNQAIKSLHLEEICPTLPRRYLTCGVKRCVLFFSWASFRVWRLPWRSLISSTLPMSSEGCSVAFQKPILKPAGPPLFINRFK